MKWWWDCSLPSRSLENAEYNCGFYFYSHDQLLILVLLDEYTFVSFVFVWLHLA